MEIYLYQLKNEIKKEHTNQSFQDKNSLTLNFSKISFFGLICLRKFNWSPRTMVHDYHKKFIGEKPLANYIICLE